MKNLIFNLSKLESIVIIADFDLEIEDIVLCDEVKVFFNNQINLRIGQQSVGNIFDRFIDRLEKAIDNKLQLHESLNQNLGFMYNEYYHEYPKNKSKFVRVSLPGEKSSYWVGLQYKIYGTFADANPYVTTWLYNDQAGNIILEVTSFYKWSVQEDDLDDPDFITYEKFIKDYKPLVYRVIPHNVAVEWLNQLKKWLIIFTENERNLNL